MKRHRLALLVLAVAALPAAAQMYKWTDANGKIHYSDTPPLEGKVEEIKVAPAPPPAPLPKGATWQERERESSQRRLAQQQEEAKAPPEPNAAQRCAAARGILSTLEGKAVFQKDKDGKRAYLEDKDRAALEKAANASAAQNCAH
ncbi:MAG: DUF4124 domain-containing protein [Pseudomonadota bacterium]